MGPRRLINRHLLDHQVESILLNDIDSRVTRSTLAMAVYKKHLNRIIKATKYMDGAASNLAAQTNNVEARLKELVKKRRERAVLNVNGCLMQIAKHREEIEGSLGFHIDKISSIRLLGKETHNQGRQPLEILFSENNKIIYKPVCMETDKFIHSYARTVIQGMGFLDYHPPSFYLPPDCGQEKFGFMTFIERRPDSLGKPESFYFVAGVWFALAELFSVVDMHHENVIASSNYPYLIDLETSFFRLSNREEVDMYDVGLVGRTEDAKKRSGLQGGENLREAEPWVDQSLIDYPRFRLWRPKICTSNRFFHDGHITCLSDYTSYFIGGFKEGSKCLASEVDEILTDVKTWSEDRCPRARHLVRPTAYYWLHLQQLVTPSIKPNSEIFLSLKSRLMGGEAAGDTINNDIVQMELFDLINGDVPYFYSALRGKDLEHHTGGIVENYFSQDALEKLQEKARALAASDINKSALDLQSTLCS